MTKPKTLSVLRHGEAELGFGKNGDFSRELNFHGKHQLHRLSEVIKNNGCCIDLILCSKATRAIQTMEIVSTGLKIKEIRLDEMIYEAGPEDILSTLNSLDSDLENVMLVGHNPGVSALISYITDVGYLSLKPGMMATVELQVPDWCMLGRETGLLKEVLQ